MSLCIVRDPCIANFDFTLVLDVCEFCRFGQTGFVVGTAYLT